MKNAKRRLWLLAVVLVGATRFSMLNFQFSIGEAHAQARKIQHRPYLDNRRLHWGFLFGMQIQDMEVKNNGFIDPTTGEQWYTDVDTYSPGFTVGMLGELRLNKHFSLRLTPAMGFGQRRIWFHEQASGRDTTQVLKSAYLLMPLDVTFAAPAGGTVAGDPWAGTACSAAQPATAAVDTAAAVTPARRRNSRRCIAHLPMGGPAPPGDRGRRPCNRAVMPVFVSGHAPEINRVIC